MNLGYNQAI